MTFLSVNKTLLLALLCWGCLSVAVAQSTKQRIQSLEQDTRYLKRMLENGQGSQTDMLQTIQSLQQENQELRNQLETLQFESGRSADRQRQLYIDLDERLQKMESGRSSGAVGATDAAGDVVLDDRGVYQAAFNKLKAGNYEQAGLGFEAFLADYETSELRDNAQYWLAETHYVRKDFEAALRGFLEVITDYPGSRKLADAWLKIGYCNYELGNEEEAQRALNTAITRFPESTAARLAKERITLMDTNNN
jgi:tol-pal system protein YbgF